MPFPVKLYFKVELKSAAISLVEDEIDLYNPPLKHDLCKGRIIDQATKTRPDRLGGPQSGILHHKVAHSWVVHLSNTPLPRHWGECDRPVSTRLHLTHFLYNLLTAQPRQPREGTQITYRQQNHHLSLKEKIVISKPISTWKYNVMSFIWLWCSFAQFKSNI